MNGNRQVLYIYYGIILNSRWTSQILFNKNHFP